VSRVLVAYATRAGATAEVASAIAEVLRAAHHEVDLAPITEVRDLADYAGLVLGSAINAGKGFASFQTFVTRHVPGSGAVPVAYFVVCATLAQHTAANRASVLAYLDPIVALNEPASIGLFAGRVEARRLNLLLRAVLREMKAPEGDWRDWAAIRAWAADLPAAMFHRTRDRASSSGWDGPR